MDDDDDDLPFLGPQGLADRWCIDRKTVLGAIARGDIPCTKLGRRWLIPVSWIEAQEMASTA